MYKEGSIIEVLGTFMVKDVNDEYAELDSYGVGNTDLVVDDNGAKEVDSEGNAKEFDGFQIGDFFQFNGTYEVVRSNELFTKVLVGDQLVSFPNHKIAEVG